MANAAFNANCPVCGAPVVAFPTTMTGGMLTGPMMAPRTREELVAACAVHGQSPYNHRTLLALGLTPPPERYEAETSLDRRVMVGFTAFWVLLALATLLVVLVLR